MASCGLVEEAKKQYRGQYTDKTQWNDVVVGDTSYIVERGRVSRDKFNLDDFKHSMAYEKKVHKSQCALCKMYFEKSSVNFKVANHLVVQKMREWNVQLYGRRYESASFLYSVANLCKFCANLFCDIPFEDTAAPPVLAITHGSETRAPESDQKSNFVPTAMLERSDIAGDQRAYQSSVVDNMDAYLAVTSQTPSSTKPLWLAKTRREVDPWWEIDLGRPQHVHSLSFLINSGIQQKLYVNVILLQHNMGFENPFLDKIVKKAVVWKEFVTEESAVSKMEEIFWELPAESICSAIRVQLKGINTLCISSFKAFRGDTLVLCTQEDLARTANSYSSMAPSMLRESISSMLSPDHKREKVMLGSTMPPVSCVSTILASAKEKKGKFSDLKGVSDLSAYIQQRHNAVASFKALVSQFVVYFVREELLVLFRVVFRPALDESPLYSAKTSGSIDEKDLFDEALDQHDPRVDVTALQEQLKSLLRKIQSRNHVKALEVLLYSEKFMVVASDLDDHLYKLLVAFKKVEKSAKLKLKNAQKVQERERKESVLKAVAFGNNRNTLNTTTGSKDVVAEAEKDLVEKSTVSWAQFCMIIALFCSQQCARIPAIVFGVGEDSGPPYLPELATKSAASSEGVAEGGGGDKTFTASVVRAQTSDERSVSSQGSARHQLRTSDFTKSAPLLGRSSPLRTAGDDMSSSGVISLRQVKAEADALKKSSLVETTKDPSRPVFNSGFAEYKLENVIKRQAVDLPFPKELRHDFNVSMVELPRTGLMSKRNKVRAQLSSTTPAPSTSANNLSIKLDALPSIEKRTASAPTTLLTSGGAMSAAAASGKTSPGKAESPSSFGLLSGKADVDTKDSDDDDGDESKNNIGFYKVCALCEQKHRRKSMEISVLWKHVISLRRKWDPSLVSKELELLDQSISMFNFVRVCVFCAQYFDPDFPDGIAPPCREVDISSDPARQLVPFFDSRYPSQVVVGKFLQDPSVKETRERAKRAVQLQQQLAKSRALASDDY